MVTTEFADRGRSDAETESARKRLPERAVSVVECDCSGADATPSPSRRGLKQNPVPGFNGNPVWSTPGGGPVGDGAPGSWGGHSVPIVGYGVDGEGNAGTEVITWGQVYDMTWGFVDNYVEEAWAVLSADWIEPDKLAPSGFSLSELQADLRDVTGQTVALTEKRSTQVRLSHLLRK